ncbi:MAG: NADH-quinone oxidoreductase subunit C, partial [Devosiaceae bacterium]|nr:NADH-quinone oxidoreductase subunit C [Devosiaceae bacterium]
MDETLKELGEYIALKLVDEVKHFTIVRGELTLFANRDDIVKVMQFLHDDNQCQFISIIDICGVDYLGREMRFEVVYHLLSPVRNLRIRVKVETDEESLVPSITDLFPGA